MLNFLFSLIYFFSFFHFLIVYFVVSLCFHLWWLNCYHNPSALCYILATALFCHAVLMQIRLQTSGVFLYTLPRRWCCSHLMDYLPYLFPNWRASVRLMLWGGGQLVRCLRALYILPHTVKLYLPFSPTSSPLYLKVVWGSRSGHYSAFPKAFVFLAVPGHFTCCL